MTIILSFSRMFTREASFLRKTTCCANPSRLKKSQLWSTQRITKWSVRKPRIPQSTADRKDNMLPQEYMWAPLFPNYLLDIQHAKDQESSTEFYKMHQRTFVRTKKCLSQHFVSLILLLVPGLAVSTFIRKTASQFLKSSLQCLSLLH